MKGKILLTGFEPFGDDKVNPSMEVAKSLDGLEINGYQVVVRILPVEWGTVKDRLEAQMDEVRPAIVISLGLAAGGFGRLGLKTCKRKPKATYLHGTSVLPFEAYVVP